MLRPGERYQARHDPKHQLRVIAVHFDPACLQDLSEIPLVTRLTDTGLVEQLLQRVVEHWPHDPKTATTYFETVLAETKRSLQPQACDTTALAVLACRDRIAADPGAPWEVTTLAQRCGWSRHHFTRTFSKHMGVSPQTYIVEQRLRAAQDLLQASNLPIGRIAEELGYQDVAFFSRQFTSKVGVTTSQFRRRH